MASFMQDATEKNGDNHNVANTNSPTINSALLSNSENNVADGDKSVLKEMCQFAPILVLSWLFVGCIGLGSTIAVQPVFFQRSFAANFAKVNYENITCPVETKDPNCLKGLNLAGTYSTYTSGLSSLLTLVLSPWMGSVADRVGKRPIFIIASILQVPSSFFVFLAIYFPGNLNFIYLYYVASTLNGSWFVAVILGAFADFCSPVNRAVGFALVLATFELSFVLGPKIGQISYDMYGIRAPYVLQLSLVLFRCVIIIFLPRNSLPTKEDLETSRHSSFASMTTSRDGAMPTNGTGGSYNDKNIYNMTNVVNKKKNSVVKLDHFCNNRKIDVEINSDNKNCFQLFYSDISSSISILNRSSLFRILTVMALVQNATSSGIQVLFSYVTRSGFHFTPEDVANLLLIVMASSFIVQAFCTKPLLSCVKERGMLAVGLVAAVANMFLSGLVLYYFEHKAISLQQSKLYVYLISGCVSSMSFFAFPALSAIKANNVAMHEQSATQGALYSARSIAGGIAPFIYGSLYHHYAKNPEIIYFVTAILNIIPIICLCMLPHETGIEKENRSKSNTMATVGNRNNSNDVYHAI